jgi:hypothetical protein
MSANMTPASSQHRKLSMSEITTWLVLLGVVVTAASAHVLLKVGVDQVGMNGSARLDRPAGG